MRMKEDRGAEKPWPKPAYNVQSGHRRAVHCGLQRAWSGRGYYLSDPPSGTGTRTIWVDGCPRRLWRMRPMAAKRIMPTWSSTGAENFLKYNTFYQDTHHYRDPEVLRAHQFRAENFGYDPDTDSSSARPTNACISNMHLAIPPTTATRPTGAPMNARTAPTARCADKCTKAKGNRQIRISFQLLEYRRQARENLTSPEGETLACCPFHRSGNRLRSSQTQYGLPQISLAGPGEGENRVGVGQYCP